MPETQVASPTTAAAPPAVVTPTPEQVTGLFDHQAIPPEKTTTEAPPAKTETKPPEISKVYAGRYKTPEELEKAYRDKDTESLRLYQEQRALAQQLSEAQARLVEVEERAKIGIVMPFKELSKEAFEKLESESPVKAAEYLFDKKLHDRDVAEAQKRTKAERAAFEKKSADTQKFILERGSYLLENPDKFPNYEKLIPEMDELGKRLGADVQGKGWAPDFLYLCALGRMYHASLLEGIKKTKETELKTKTAVSATAAAAASGAASVTETPTDKDPNSDEAVMQRILKAGNKALFKV